MPTIYLNHGTKAHDLYFGDAALARLQTLGTVLRNPRDSEPSPEELAEAAQDADIIVAFRIPAIPAHVLDSLPRLAAVCRVAVDVRNIDLAAASRNGILVTQATPGFGPSVAEWIIGAMLGLARGICDYNASYHQGGQPVAAMGRELGHSTLGIIGYGTIGQHLSRLALAFGMKVLVHDPYASVQNDAIAQLNLDALLNRSDFVACLAPATPETQGLMGKSEFQAMRRSAFFINASRGELVDEAALLHALNTGIIAGAALDVGMAADQRPSPALATHPRVIATPHIGGLTPPAATHQAMDAVRQVEAILAGRMPRGALNGADAWRTQRLCQRLEHDKENNNVA
ncbi:MAG: hydroxyacid dehydrogenase [Burkholderiaceae bacterium]